MIYSSSVSLDFFLFTSVKRELLEHFIPFVLYRDRKNAVVHVVEMIDSCRYLRIDRSSLYNNNNNIL